MVASTRLKWKMLSGNATHSSLLTKSKLEIDYRHCEHTKHQVVEDLFQHRQASVNGRLADVKVFSLPPSGNVRIS